MPRSPRQPLRTFPVGREPSLVRRVNERGPRGLDSYLHLLTMPWSAFFAVLAAVFLAFNLAFALLFLAERSGIANARPGSFADAFFFSVQTMATIGYGQMYPQTLYANLLVTLEVLLGMTILALATGLIFARFSRPTARIVFSRVAVVAPHNGVPTLMFRAGNQRHNRILEAQVTVAMLREEVTTEGERVRRFHDLRLSRAKTPMFALTWTIMHAIDENSPLYGATAERLKTEQAEIVVMLIGLDETFVQTIHARHSYAAEEILWNRRFTDILARLDDGTRVVDFQRFHDVEQFGG
jgi:inward rectifier potassium channel